MNLTYHAGKHHAGDTLIGGARKINFMDSARCRHSYLSAGKLIPVVHIYTVLRRNYDFWHVCTWYDIGG